jgi:hypothetical protein
MIQIPESLASLGCEELLSFAMEVKKQQLLIKFNEYNRLKYSAPPAPDGIT